MSTETKPDFDVIALHLLSLLIPTRLMLSLTRWPGIMGLFRGPFSFPPGLGSKTGSRYTPICCGSVVRFLAGRVTPSHQQRGPAGGPPVHAGPRRGTVFVFTEAGVAEGGPRGRFGTGAA